MAIFLPLIAVIALYLFSMLKTETVSCVFLILRALRCDMRHLQTHSTRRTLARVNEYSNVFECQIINIHHQIRDDWNLLRDKEECDIMEQNAYFGKNLIRYLFGKRKKNLYFCNSYKRNI